MFSFYQATLGCLRWEPKTTPAQENPAPPVLMKYSTAHQNLARIGRDRTAAGLASSCCLAFTSYKSADVTNTQTHSTDFNKGKDKTLAHTFLHHHFNRHKPCQYLMSRSLPGWYQLSFRDNVSDVSIPFPVPMHSPHWHRYNGLEDRTNDILAHLFSLCPPLKDSIMCNPMPRQTPRAWTHSPLFPTT